MKSTDQEPDNCKSTEADYMPTLSQHPEPVAETYTLCKVGSNFQLIEYSGLSPLRELSFSLTFKADEDIICTFLEDVLEFIEETVSVGTDTEEALPAELEVDQKLLAECQGNN